MKRILSLILALTLCLPVLAVPALAAEAPDQNTEFTDVDSGDYFYAPVQWAVKEKVTTGTSATEFSPDRPCTQAQIITFLWRAAGSPEPEGASSFPDVDPDMYYAKAAAWAQEKGIVTGTEFDPDGACTRQLAVEFLWRNAGKPKAPKASFKDANWPSADWAVEQGITTGTTKTTFSPQNICTRGQIITFLYRALAKNVRWNLLFVIFTHTDISYTDDSGNQIVDKQTMTDEEVERLISMGQPYVDGLYEVTDHAIFPYMKTIVVDTPITFDNLARYGEAMYWMNAAGAKKLLPDYVDLDKYDHVTVLADIEAETLGNANYWGLGGTYFDQQTGYSFLRVNNTNYAMWAYDMDRKWMPTLFIHEFMHFMESWSKTHGCPLTIKEHDNSTLGYKDDPYWGWKEFLTDFARHEVPLENGYTGGVPAAVWRQPPSMFR